eukprot:3113834-Pyramimonas_sp.AAC.1
MRTSGGGCMLPFEPGRHLGDLCVLKVPSHVDAAEVVGRDLPGHLIAGNVVVDVLAGSAARLCPSRAES